MFLTRRKRYNADVAALVPAFHIDMEKAGETKMLDILNVGWNRKYNVYEAALLVAYSYSAGLYERQRYSAADEMVFERIKPVQEDWLKEKIVRPKIIDNFNIVYEKNDSPARLRSFNNWLIANSGRVLK